MFDSFYCTLYHPNNYIVSLISEIADLGYWLKEFRYLCCVKQSASKTTIHLRSNTAESKDLSEVGFYIYMLFCEKKWNLALSLVILRGLK